MLNSFWPSVILFLCLTASTHAAVVLQYHHVSDDTPVSTSISPKLFQQHLDYLYQEGYRVWPLKKLSDALLSAQTIPDKVVVITFDDAYDSIIDTAFPLLKQYNFPFTVFVSTEVIDQKVPAFMDWEQLRQLHQAGVMLANHGHRHIHFVRRLPKESSSMWLARITDDIQTASQRLKQELGVAHKFLAYPYGEYTNDIAQRVKSLDYMAFGQQSGAIGPGMSLTALPRFPMTNHFGAMAQFKTKVSSLPLAMSSITPPERIVSTNQFAQGLKITFRQSVESPACYVSGYGRVPIQHAGEVVWLESMPRLPIGRSRINCTAPSSEKNKAGRYHWFSYFWMKPHADGGWYTEH